MVDSYPLAACTISPSPPHAPYREAGKQSQGMLSGLSTQFLAFLPLPSVPMIRYQNPPLNSHFHVFISPASPKTVTTADIHTQGVGTGRNRGAEFMHCNALCCLLLTTACLAVAYSNHLLMVVTECSCIAQISEFMLCVIHGE